MHPFTIDLVHQPQVPGSGRLFAAAVAPSRGEAIRPSSAIARNILKNLDIRHHTSIKDIEINNVSIVVPKGDLNRTPVEFVTKWRIENSVLATQSVSL